jgi:RNA polymerase sigma-70 factor (ECF subfamily)
MQDQQLPLTSLTLLAALRRGLRWEEFVALYGGQILRWCRQRFALQEADAEDVRQELLVKVWKYLGSYDQARGRFRTWLFRCTCNALSDLRQRLHNSNRDTATTDPDWLAHLQAPEVETLARENSLEGALELLEEEGFGDEELEKAVLQVRDRVEETTWKCFLLSVFLDLKGQDIATRLGMTPMAVYQAISRVRKLLAQAASASTEGADVPSKR